MNCPDCQQPLKPKKSWGGLLACYCRWNGRKPSARQIEAAVDAYTPPHQSQMNPPELPAWECQQPLIKGQPTAPWIGLEVIQRPDGGGWPMEPGTVEAKAGEPPESGWFRLITARHPQGITTHTQEVYPPGFTGCPLPCCCLQKKPFTLQ